MILCLSEKIHSDDKILNIEDYDLIRADHPENKKRRGMYVLEELFTNNKKR